MRVIRKMKSDMALTIEPDPTLAYPQHSFHESFSFVIVFGQFFGIMPLYGMTRKNIQDVQFKWKSFRFLYACYNIAGAFVMGAFCILKFALHGLMLDQAGPTSFYILNFCGAVQFIVLAKNWSNVLKEWSLMEMSMRGYGSVVTMKRRHMIMTTVVMTLALGEYLV